MKIFKYLIVVLVKVLIYMLTVSLLTINCIRSFLFYEVLVCVLINTSVCSYFNVVYNAFILGVGNSVLKFQLTFPRVKTNTTHNTNVLSYFVFRLSVCGFNFRNEFTKKRLKPFEWSITESLCLFILTIKSK